MILRFFVIMFTVFSATSHAASLDIPKEENYLDGKAFCQIHEKLIAYEKGFYTKTSNSNLYAWFQEPYDAEKPTVVYLTGGPGQTSHWGQQALVGEFNLLLIDQRGIACSKPETYEDFLSPSFYSVKNIALDLEEVRKNLNINEWTIYGVSFGTIPATIYASLFPAHTRSLILEGVSFDTKGLWQAQRVKFILNEELGALPSATKEQLRNLKEPKWFFQWAKTQLLQNEGRTTLKEELSKLSDPTSFQDFSDMLESYYGPREPHEKNDLYELNEIPYYMFACQELGLLTEKSELDFDKNGEIVNVENPEAISNCKKLNLEPVDSYQAFDYSLNVPTFYFQGENDSATSATGAFNHYASVAKGTKQFFLLMNGGHNPNLQILRDDNVAQKEILMKAIKGERSPEALIDAANSELSVVKWLVK